MVTVRSGVDSFAVAVDGAGDVFVNGEDASVVYEIEAGTGGNAPGAVSSSSTMVAVGSGFYYPSGLALDAAGDVFVADGGNKAVKEIEAGTGGNAPGVVSSSSTVVTLGSGFSGPTALAVDGAGNVFISDTAVEELVLTTPPSLSFASTAVGSTSSDSPQTVVLQNAGNASLSFPVPGFGSNPSLAANFTLGSTSTCPQVTSSSGSAGTLGSSGLCTEVLNFTPTTAGSITGSLVLTDDSLNPGTTTTQTVNLSGTATPATATVTVQPATIVYGSTSTTLTASISFAGTIAPIGAVTFTVDSGTTVTASCTGSSSLLTCAASYATGSLVAGTHTITVSMVADTNYSAASNTAALTVTQAATVTTVSASAVSVNPSQECHAHCDRRLDHHRDADRFGDLLRQRNLAPAGLAKQWQRFVDDAVKRRKHAYHHGDLFGRYRLFGRERFGNRHGDRDRVRLHLLCDASDFIRNGRSRVARRPIRSRSRRRMEAYGGPVTFTITGLPAGATASFSPAVIAANAGPQSITLTVQTAQLLARNDRPNPFRKELPLTALLLLPLISSCKLRRRWNSRLLMLTLLVAGLGGSMLLSGCGAEPGEQAASYTLTVTATSGQEQHSQTVTLIVQ